MMNHFNNMPDHADNPANNHLHEFSNPEYPVGIYEVDVRNMYMDIVHWHWHDDFELIYVEEGCAQFLVSNDVYMLSKGEGIFINRDILHSVQPMDGKKECRYVSIVFHHTFLFHPGEIGLSSTYLHPIAGNSQLTCFRFNGERAYQKEILSLIAEIIDKNRTKASCRELYTKDYLLRIWILIYENCVNDPATQKMMISAKNYKAALDEARAKIAIRYIEEHYTEAVTLEDIAASIHVSRSECCRCIKRCMKMSPFEYLMRYRILAAANKLSDPLNHVSMADLASSVGFNSSSYFNKLFRKYLKCTPTQYKARQLSGGRE